VLTLFADGDFRLANWSPDHDAIGGDRSRGGEGGGGRVRPGGQSSGDGHGKWGDYTQGGKESCGGGAVVAPFDAFSPQDDALRGTTPSSREAGGSGSSGGGGSGGHGRYHTVEGSWRPVEGVGVRLWVDTRVCVPGFGGYQAGDDREANGAQSEPEAKPRNEDEDKGKDEDEDEDGDEARGRGRGRVSEVKEAGTGTGTGTGTETGTGTGAGIGTERAWRSDRWVDVTLRARRVGSRRVELWGALTTGGRPVSFWRRT
jgi:hypothetical protein